MIQIKGAHLHSKYDVFNFFFHAEASLVASLRAWSTNLKSHNPSMLFQISNNSKPASTTASVR